MYKVKPKQIINKISYLNFLTSNHNSDHKNNFTENFKNFIGMEYNPIYLGRARIGIYLLIKNAIKTNKKKVILSPYTIPDVINMVILAGGEPVFIDFISNSTNIDINQLEKLINHETAVVLITHYHTNQNDFENIKLICNKFGSKLFEDCAISLGASYNNIHVGLNSDGGILSFSGYKSLNFLWGGAIISNDLGNIDSINNDIKNWKTLSKLQYFSQFKKILTYDLLTRNIIFDRLTFPVIKYNQKKNDIPVDFSLPRIESIKLSEDLLSLPHSHAYHEWNNKLMSMPEMLLHRRKIFSVYSKYFSNIQISKETKISILDESACVNYPIYIGVKRRNSLYKEVIIKNIDVGLSLYPSCSKYPNFNNIKGYSDNSENLASSIITLPTHARITEDYANYISKVILKLI